MGPNRGQGQSRWSPIWPFGLLCALGASRWLIENAVPSATSTLGSELLGGCGASILLLAFALSSRRASGPQPLHARDRIWTTAAGAIVLTAPSLSFVLAGQAFNGNVVSLALALTPLVIAVAISASADDESEGISARLWPSLAGVAGLLLMVPQPALSGLRSWAGLAVLPVAMGCAAVLWIRRLRKTQDAGLPSLSGECGLALLGAAAVLGALLVFRVHAGQQVEWHPSAAVLDGLTDGLTAWTLAQVGPASWGAQFLCIPVLGLVEGAILLRPTLDTRFFAAAVLLMAGTWAQWRSGRDKPAGDT